MIDIYWSVINLYPIIHIRHVWPQDAAVRRRPTDVACGGGFARDRSGHSRLDLREKEQRQSQTSAPTSSTLHHFLSATMSLYRYSPISSEPESIRLLSLAPSPDPSAPIHCRLIHYSLLNDNGGDHLYEALSYTWGDPTQRDIIFVEGKRLNITTSLYTALQRLRNAHFERVIWADAVCINQDDLKERGSQIKYMAKIYAKASQVVVWLGEEADDSTIAFQHISLAADSTAPGLAGAEVNRQAVLALLGRPWFRRIWVSCSERRSEKC